jgi:glycosyltransferase involved in cell wall biosynthesis
MAVFNGEKFLKEAIDSIIYQTWPDFEFIVVDDGSMDRTASILASYTDDQIRVLRNPENLGLVRSLNIGIKLCLGKYVARMDAHDISHPERFTKQVAYMQDDPEFDIFGTNISLMDHTGAIQKKKSWVNPTNPLEIR